jgi:predicted nicotinamide N-methyase
MRRALAACRPVGFFDDYPAFFETSRTGSAPNRLKARHTALIESNPDVVTGRRILDIASHDGTWSFAALRAGAAHVTGIEARDEVVERGADTADFMRWAHPQR